MEVFRASWTIKDEGDTAAVIVAFSNDVVDWYDWSALDDKLDDNVTVVVVCASEVVEFRYAVDVKPMFWETVEE